MKKHFSKRLISLVLALAVCLGLAIPVGAADTNATSNVRIRKIDNSAVSASLRDSIAVDADETAPLYKDTDIVRVSIILKEKSTIEQGFSIENIAENSKAIAYRQNLQTRQDTLAEKISKEALGGKNLDIVWNLTLAANLISANVPYGSIESIKAVKGVKTVVVEDRYDPMVASVEPVNPNMATSSEMIGSSLAWAAGYNGVGSKIAVIDTGTDTDHQSFDAKAFEYAITEDEAAGKEANLMTVADIEKVLSQLHVSQRTKGVTAEELYVNPKLPFGYNYIDKDFDLTHDNDKASEHGSHVAGISTANRYIPDGKGGFTAALESVHTQGVAPDAQLITMKVFGKAGGAYPSDYMAAIEDAIVLGCDSINLSLGSSNPGTSTNAEYQTILDNLTEAGAVVCISAGNSGSWVDSAASGIGYLYSDDVSLDTVGSPGSYTNSLAVASVDNIGQTGNYLSIDGKVAFFSETEYSNAPIVKTLDTTGEGTEYEYLLFQNTGADASNKNLLTDYAEAIKGKVVMVYRGVSSFYQKHEAVAAVGAAACIVVNNQPGVINMDLTDSKATIPCVSITQASGDAIIADATPVYAEDGTTVLYYKGKITVSDAVSSIINESKYYTMSSFSSWGVPGSLQLKPEITAPGGSIYSVNGAIAGGKAYEVMSGTSMAAPQVNGMMALMAQYIRENDLTAKTGLTARQLAQSLLMSTSVPVIEEESKNYYSILKQGSGLADINAAINASSYIMMNADANAGAKDGKVKVELGDDPARKGEYTFSYTLTNLKDTAMNYTLNTDVFTQDLIAASRIIVLLYSAVTDLPSVVTYEVNGKLVQSIGYYEGLTADDAQAILDYAVGKIELTDDQLSNYDLNEDGKVTTFDAHLILSSLNKAVIELPADGSVEVKVTIKLNQGTKDYLDHYYTSGAYIEAYSFADEFTSEEGVKGTSHSIPVLGFYGNWTDGSMYDKGSYWDFQTGAETRPPYLPGSYTKYNTMSNLLTLLSGGELYAFGGNPYDSDEAYNPERNAFSAVNGDILYSYEYSPIRNAAASRVTVTDAETGEVYLNLNNGAVNGAFYYVNGGAWQEKTSVAKMNWQAAGVPDGAKVNVSLTLAPEYYVDAKGSVNWEALGKGATLTTSMTIDNTAPEVTYVDGENGISVTAKDNQYIAAIALLNKNGSAVLAEEIPGEEAVKGETYTWDLDMTETYGKKFLLAVFDYAGNQSTYEVELEESHTGDITGAFLAVSGGKWVAIKDGEVKNLTDVDPVPAGAAYVGGYLFTVSGTETSAKYISVSDMDLIGSPARLSGYRQGNDIPGDLAYSETDETLYYIHFIKADGSPESTDMTVLSEVDMTTGSVKEVGTIKGLSEAALSLTCDTEGNFYTVEMTTGKLFTFKRADVEAGSDVVLVGETGWKGNMANNNGAPSIAWNKADGMIYQTNHFNDDASQTALLKIDPKTAETTKVCDIPANTTALVIPDDSTLPAVLMPDAVKEVKLSKTAFSMIKGTTEQLTAQVNPWSVADKSVTWSSSDPSIATVDENGLVTAIADGEVTITAASTVKPDVTAVCDVEVFTINMTVKGLLQDTEGNPQMFSWNLTESTWKKDKDVTPSVDSVTLDTKNNVLYLADASSDSWSMHAIDPATGETLASYANGVGVPMWDMTYNPYFSEQEDKPIVSAVYNYFLLAAQDPTALNTMAFDMSDPFSKYTRADYAVALTSLGKVPVEDEDGNPTTTGEMIFVLDNRGYMWIWTVYKTDEGYSANINWLESDLDLSFPGYENDMYCSMIADNDGVYLYLSAFNGDTNEIYRLSLVQNSAGNMMISGLKIGDVGENVWPAALYEALDNATADTGAIKLTEVASAPKAGETIQAKAELVDANELRAHLKADDKTNGSLNAVKVTEDAVQATKNLLKDETTGVTVQDSGRVYLDITADASTNGLIEVEYDSDVLTFIGVENGNLAMVSGNGADGSAKFAYASGKVVNGRVGTLVFSYDKHNCPYETDVTIKTLEDCDAFNTASSTLEVKLRTRPTVVPVDPTPVDPTPVDPTPVDPTPVDPKPEFPFTDVSEDHMFYEDIKYVYEKGLMEGTGNNKFSPETVMTRGMIVTTLYRMEGKPAVNANITFSDVASGMYYTDAVAWAAENGIVKGCGDGTFRPNDTITREQMVTILYRYAKYKGCDVSVGEDTNILSFDDAEQVAPYAIEAFEWAGGAGIINGTSKTTLSPKGSATRGQVAAILHRYCDWMK